MINRITATGTLVAIKAFENGNGSITLATKTAYRVRGKDSVRDDYIVFNINDEKLIKNIRNRFKVGNHVNVSGTVHSYIRFNDGSTKEIVNFYADSVEPLITDYEKTFGYPGGHYPQDTQSICLEGTIDSISRIGSGVLIRLNISDEKPNYITIMAYDALAKKAEEFSLNDRVCICTRVTTTTFSGETKTYKTDYNRFYMTAIDRMPEPLDSKKTA